MSNQFLINNRIYLRAVEPSDLDFMYSIENDSQMWDISSFTVPYSKYVLRQYIECSQTDIYSDKQIRLIIVRKEDDKRIGTLDITDFVPLHKRGAVGIAVLKEYRRNGYALDAIKLLCDYSFRFLHFKQLYAHIPEDNEASLALFTASDFKKAGVLTDWLLTENGYKNAVIMQCINPME